MEGPLISVIVPVYKVEKYLDRCVQSIVDQTYRNLEIILVDDGSPDNCGSLCDAWAEKDSRIRVIHKENGGLSDARNAGMAVAMGAYIAFVDSDDWLDRNYAQVLYRLCEEHGCDIAECGFQYTTGEESVRTASDAVTVATDAEAMQRHIRNEMFKQVVWNKLYRREVVSVPFEKGKCHEDEFWTYQIIANCRKLVHIDRPMYFYFQRSDSIMGEGYSLKRLDAVEARIYRNEFVRKNYPNLAWKTSVEMQFTCIYHGQLMLRKLDQKQYSEGVAVLKQCMAQCRLRSKEFGALKLTHKCWLILAKWNFKGCCQLRNLLGIGL